MSFDIKIATQTLSPAEIVPYDGDPVTYETATWGERIVTVVATVLGAGALFLPSGFAYHDGAVYVSNWSTMPADNGGGPTGQVVRIPVG